MAQSLVVWRVSAVPLAEHADAQSGMLAYRLCVRLHGVVWQRL
jgi:hypothetical protein